MNVIVQAGLLSEAMEEFMTSSTNRSILRFVKLLLMTFFVTHFFSCAFVYVGEQQVREANAACKSHADSSLLPFLSHRTDVHIN